MAPEHGNLLLVFQNMISFTNVWYDLMDSMQAIHCISVHMTIMKPLNHCTKGFLMGLHKKEQPCTNFLDIKAEMQQDNSTPHSKKMGGI